MGFGNSNNCGSIWIIIIIIILLFACCAGGNDCREHHLSGMW